MCLSMVYDKEPAPERLLMKNVQSIRIENGCVTLTDIMERTRSIAGSLVSADLVNGVVILNAE